MRTKIIIPAIFLSFVLLVAFSTGENEEVYKSNKEIIKFSHELHAEDVACEDCHTGVPESTTLTGRLLPEKDVCATCHDVDDDEECGTCHYEDVYEPLVQDKSGLYFSHSQHVNDNTKCTTCHKGIEKVAYAGESMGANPPMETCYTCHGDTKVASSACEACHVSNDNLIPNNHKKVNFAKNHKFLAEESENCVMCHEDPFCETCHNATVALDVTNTADDFYTPYSPHSYTGNHKNQQITRVHELNYRYSHGIDARGKTSDCATCHQTEQFCVECHNLEGGDHALGGFLPTSHTVANFLLIGAGSGGGKHADFAKRDIESCASCHDVQGGDANCILCHSDPDGIQGTNAKTHESMFRHDEHGDWHDDEGSLCFNCHTDANARPAGISGVQFCGYCHK